MPIRHHGRRNRGRGLFAVVALLIVLMAVSFVGSAIFVASRNPEI